MLQFHCQYYNQHISCCLAGKSFDINSSAKTQQLKHTPANLLKDLCVNSQVVHSESTIEMKPIYTWF